MNRTYRLLSRSVAVGAACLFCAAISMRTLAADKYWVGAGGTWDTTTANWATNSGGTANQFWVPGDNAIIEGSGGTITLAADMNIANLYIPANDYTITGSTLIFAPGGVISNDGSRFTLATGVTGSPDVYTMHALATGDRCYFAPVSAPMILGKIYRYKDNYFTYQGSAAGNTIEEIPDLAGSWIGTGKNNKNDMSGTADWTVGNAWFGDMTLNGGTLICTGEVTLGWRYLTVNSGSVLHLNHAGAITQSGRLRLAGGSLDNSSGSNITSSVYNPSYALMGDTTFIGTHDLNMGSGTATMDADRIITVSNVAATLTIAGTVSSSGNGYSLTKEGAGTLSLTGTNTYLGETIVNVGTLRLTQTSLSDVSAVRIVNGAVLNLDYSGMDDVLAVYTNGVEGPTGTWGALASGATNETALITGTGFLRVVAPTPLDGIRYWDGGTTNIASVGNGISDGAGGTWSTSVKNWDAGAGVAHTNWNNATNDAAFFRGGGGTVTLAEDANVGDLTIDSDGYTITGNALHFSAGSSISNNGNNTVISSGITGSPDVLCRAGGNETFRLQPTSTSMTLGTIYRLEDNYLHLRGTAAENTVVAMPYPTASGFYQQNVKVHKYGSGTWTVNGELYGGEVRVYDGTLICNGKLWENKWEIEINGGTLIANGSMEGSLNFTLGTLGGTAVVASAVSVPAGGTLAPGYPTGTMTVSNNCTIAGTLDINVDGSQHSRLDITPGKALTISNATLNVTVGASTPASDLIIATYGNLNGKFAATNGIDTWDVDYNYQGGNAIALLPPASGTVLIIR